VRACHVFVLASLAGLFALACGPAPEVPKPDEPCRTGTLAACDALCEAGNEDGCKEFGLRVCKEGSVLECEAACDADNVTACTELAEMYGSGTRVPSDSRRYYAIRDKTCRLGVLDHCRELAHHFGDPIMEPTPRDKALAATYYRRLCVEGDLQPRPDAIRACKEQAPGQSRSHFNACIEREHQRAHVVEEDCAHFAQIDPEGVAIFVRSCHGGDLGACGRLADGLEKEVERDFPGEYEGALRTLCHEATVQQNHASDTCGRLKDLGLAHGTLR
jgi:hypothetical protein